MGYWFQGRHDLSPASQEGFPKAPGWWMFPTEQAGKEGHLFMCAFTWAFLLTNLSWCLLRNTCLLTGQALGRSSRQAQSESARKSLLLEADHKVPATMPSVCRFPFSELQTTLWFQRGFTQHRCLHFGLLLTGVPFDPEGFGDWYPAWAHNHSVWGWTFFWGECRTWKWGYSLLRDLILFYSTSFFTEGKLMT